MLEMDTLVGWLITISRGEKEVFTTREPMRYWQALETLAGNRIQHRGVARPVRGGKKTSQPREVVYRVFVKRKDFSRAQVCMHEKRGQE